MSYEFAVVDDRRQSSDGEIWIDDFDAYRSEAPSYNPEIESMPDGEARRDFKFTDGGGALYVRAAGAYASPLE